MKSMLQVVSPVDGSIYAERPLAAPAQIAAALDRASRAQADWKQTSIRERAAICRRFVTVMLANADAIGQELTWQMGRPIAQNPNELRGFEERAYHMIEIAADALADIDVGEKPGFNRFIRREPLGVVLTVAAWNYPYLIAVNSVVPAIMAGNAVLLKHSAQTPLCAERFNEAFAKAGLPEGVFQDLTLSHADTEGLIRDPRIAYVAFTGSVAGGRAIQRAAAERFVGVGLELGGKDPAYVRPDCDLDATVENLADGAFYNSGQSCCAIERIYAHAQIYDDIVDGIVSAAKQYRLGNPLDTDVSLGPVVRASAAEHVRGQIADAVARGARALIDPALFPAARDGTPYLAPQVLTGVAHDMQIMRDETFGPAVGIMKVDDDEEAVALMNDSDLGLTASIWTRDEDAALAIGAQVETGTWFMNRCDYLDPALSWTGVKDSGRGCTLSRLGYEHLTRPKSFHLRNGR